MKTIKTTLSRPQFFHALDDAYRLFRRQQPQDRTGRWPVVICPLIEEFDAHEAMLTVLPPEQLAEKRVQLGWLARAIVASPTVAFDVMRVADSSTDPAFYVQVSVDEPVVVTVQLVSDDPLVRQQYDAFCGLLSALDVGEPEPEAGAGVDGITDDEIAEAMEIILQDERTVQDGGAVDQAGFTVAKRIASAVLYRLRRQANPSYTKAGHALDTGINSADTFKSWETRHRERINAYLESSGCNGCA